MELYKKVVKCIIFSFILLLIISLYTSKTFATTINSSDIFMNVDSNGLCNIEEKIEVTAIDESSAYTYNYAPYPSIQLLRGDNIINFKINNLELHDYYDKWWPNRSSNFDNFSIINLFYSNSGKYQYLLSYTKKANITSYKDMQILYTELMFGKNEINLNNRTLEIQIDNNYPLELSIDKAIYDVKSFEQDSKVKLQMNSVEGKVDLYFKFPLNTFSINDENIDLTFDEYNKETKGYNIEFISSSQLKKNSEQNDNVIIIFVIIIIIIILKNIDISSIIDMFSIKYNRCVKKYLKKGIIYRDGLMKYRFRETSDGNEKDFGYYRKSKYTPKEIYEIVNGKEIMSFEIITHKKRVIEEIRNNYIKYNSLLIAIEFGMPDKLEYKVTWLHQKIYCLEEDIAKGPKHSEQSWHGPYGWQYHSTEKDIMEFNKLKQELKNCKIELYDLEMKKNDNNKDEWYWIM